MNPSTTNYTLGKGALYFDMLNQSTGLYEGERHLGNAPEVLSNVELEKLDHYSSLGGLKAKDKSIIAQITPMINFTLDEMSVENSALQYMATMADITQGADDDVVLAIAGVNTARYYDLGLKNVGIFTLSYDGGSVIMHVGDELTGATSGATAEIVQIIGNATSGTLYLKGVTGTFANDEVINDDNVAVGAAVANGVCALLTTAVSVEDTDAAGTFYTAATDFTVDTVTGRIYIVDGGAITDGTNITVTYACASTTYKKLIGFMQTQIEGRLRFVSDNPAGKDREMLFHSVSLTPSGDSAYIGDDWSLMQFEGEILKDSENFPLSPYVDIYMDIV